MTGRGAQRNVSERGGHWRGARLKAALRKGFALLALGVLAGCASENSDEAADFWTDLYRTAQTSFAQYGAPPPQAPPLTRARLQGFDLPLVRITNMTSGASGTLVPAASRGTGASRLITWRGVEPVSFTTRGDLLIATRGAGQDLISSDLQAMARALQAGGGSYERSHVVLVGNTEGRTLRFSCSLQAMGSETVTIVERSFATTRFTESCTGPAGTFRNDYWRDGRDGTLWQSRQWAGPELGHLLIERVIK